MYLIKNIKKLFLVSNVIFSLVVAFSAHAQEITAIDFNGSPIGKVIPDGKVVSFDNKLLGNVTADSLIVNSKGELVGGVVPQGVAIGNDAKFLGKVGNDGSVRSASGQIIGKSLPNGLVVNEYFEIIGQIIFPGLVYNDEGKISGRVTGDGLYTNLAGVQIGIVTPDGYAYRKVGNDHILDGRLISSKMVVSLNGEFIGSVVPGGQVTDFNSELIGNIKANGFVYDSNNEIIGRIVSSGYAFDNNGYYLGFVSYNGEVVYNNKVVGKSRADKMIVNINGVIVGRQVDFAATATDLNGRYLGRLLPDGKLAKAETSNGLVGARGNIFNASGIPIGSLIKTGPIYDYKGELKGHALSNGAVISLNGTTIGYMIGENAYNLSGIIIGAILPPKVVYSSNDTFMGLTGISSSLDNKGNKFSVSPFGYVFSQSGAAEGKAKNIDTFYTPFGSVSGYQGLNGRVFSPKGADIGRIGGFGFVLNSQNQMIAKNINDFLAINYQGQSVGILNDENMLLNKSLSAVAKVLPDSSVSEIKSGNLNYMPKIGQAYTGNIALDFNGNFLGYADVLGGINNSSGAKIGRVVERSLVVDNNGIVIGSLFDYQGAVNDKCEFLGVVSSQGSIYNYRDVYVGKILSNGMVVSDSGSKLGHMIPKSAVIDFNGRIIGYTDYGGGVSNERGEIIGCLDARHQLRNADNALIGSVVSFEPVISFDNKIMGYSTVNGLVVDKNNDLIAYQQPNGNVNSNSGIVLGMLFKYKVAFNFDNKFIGYISRNGKVIDAQNNEIGDVNFDGYVISSKDKIGYALYDFYVYDGKGNVVGIISRNGDVSSFTNQNIGIFDRGFVLKGNEVIARGNRDYNIRDKERKVIGELQLDGKVIDNLNNNIGNLSIDGKIKNANGEEIAEATSLQYYNSSSSVKKRQMIFDENGNFIGYLDENGNLVDANGNIIGRLDENGNLIDVNGNIIGKIGADGKVIDDNSKDIDSAEKVANIEGEVYDNDGNIIGISNEKGEVYDGNGNLLGHLDENGNLIDANGNIIGHANRQWFDKASIISTIGSQPQIKEDISPALELLEDRKYLKSLGIALTPDGEYLGDILEDDSVVDENGNVIGYRMPDGLIIDHDGNLIGTEEFDDMAELEDGNVFVPAGSFGPGGAYGVGTGNAGNLGPGGGYGPGERYDPTRQAALNAAMQERRQNISVGKISSGIRKEAFDGYQKDWSEQGIPKSISSWRVDMTEMIFSDKPIPAVIARAIDTNNPAPVTAYVERNVYAEEGRNIIIPSGSRLIGSFGSITAAAEATSESARVQISWERLIRPDGSIFVFSGQTADAQGRAGALGYVDQQLFKKYTMPVVTTVLTSAASFFIAAADDDAGQIENSKQQAANDARQNFLDDMEALFDDILADKTDVKAMTYIPAGTRIIIYPNTDLWLRSVDRDSEESQKFQKPEILIDDVKVGKDNEQRHREDVAKAAGGSVVYDPDDVSAESVGSESKPLIVDTAPKKTNTIAPPPPPTGGTLPTSGSTPPVTTTTSGSSDNSIPALF
ncbi:MAG: hypothetical protein E7020_06635 [Alphaproteobacteria bacterium]|nr:hypothetical protein [Alphaproteobacteria bacterium]